MPFVINHLNDPLAKRDARAMALKNYQAKSNGYGFARRP